jgi:flagellar motor protein MotB
MENFQVPAGQVAHVRGYADRKLRYPDQPYDVRNRRISIAILYNT